MIFNPSGLLEFLSLFLSALNVYMKCKCMMYGFVCFSTFFRHLNLKYLLSRTFASVVGVGPCGLGGYAPQKRKQLNLDLEEHTHTHRANDAHFYFYNLN
jgi:hypothetical protein